MNSEVINLDGKEREEQAKSWICILNIYLKHLRCLKWELLVFKLGRIMAIFEHINIITDKKSVSGTKFNFFVLLFFKADLVSCILLFKKKNQSWSTSAQNPEQTTASSVFTPCTAKTGIFPFCTWFTVCCSDATKPAVCIPQYKLARATIVPFVIKFLSGTQSIYFISPHQR